MIFKTLLLSQNCLQLKRLVVQRSRVQFAAQRASMTCVRGTFGPWALEVSSGHFSQNALWLKNVDS